MSLSNINISDGFDMSLMQNPPLLAVCWQSMLGGARLIQSTKSRIKLETKMVGAEPCTKLAFSQVANLVKVWPRAISVALALTPCVVTLVRLFLPR